MISTPVADQRFIGAYRLQKTDDFSSVFAFRRSFRGRLLIMHYRPSESNTARLGVIVAKRFAKRANQRNLVKRIMREQFRRIRATLPAYDIVVRLNAPLAGATRAAINDDMSALLGRLATLGKK